MATFGGSGWPAATQTQTASPFGGGAFASASKPSPFASNPFGAQPTAQGNGNDGPRNPFSTTSGAAPAPQPNPFGSVSTAATTTTTTAPPVKNPFQQASSQTTAPSIFGAKATTGFGALSQPQANRSPSPFSVPSNQGRSTNPTLNAQANAFAPSTTNLNNGNKPAFGTQFGARKTFGAPSDAEQSDDSKRSKRKNPEVGGGHETKKNGVKDGARASSFGAQDAQKNGRLLKGALSNGPSNHGKKVHFDQQPAKDLSRTTKRPGAQGAFNQPNQANTKPKSNNNRLAPGPITTNDPYAKQILLQLAKDGIRAPTWPADPGKPSSKNVMMQFREDYKEYREKARASLIRAGLIDNPDDRKRLEDAIDFKGICEDMCPEFEKVTRITEFDIKHAEKDPSTSWADTTKMVKKLARSAAGQEAPLPMDVRSVAALRRTLDYLIDDLLESDDNLPVVHGFLWDRTRAIRRDFAFFSSLNPEEMRDQVYCLETIARFHVTSLHLLAQPDFAYEDYSEQQEVEQLGKTLISLMYAYNDCSAQGITCPNEAEFRAYQLVFRAFHPDVLENVQREWDPRFWRESDEIRTAVSLVEALQNTQDFHGPLKGAPSFAAASAYNSYLRIVADSSVSFTMACFAEIHFGQLRRSMLSAIKKAFSRPKQTPKDITAAVLNSYLQFDTVDEAVEFAEIHGLEFAPDDNDPDDMEKGYLILEYGHGLEYPRLHHSFSENLVESKRSSHTLPDIIHQTVYQDQPAASQQLSTDEDSLFVTSTFSEPSKAQSPYARRAVAPTSSASPFAQNPPPNTPFSSVTTTKPSSSPFTQPSPSSNGAPGGFQQGFPKSASPFGAGTQPTSFPTPGTQQSTTPGLGLASSRPSLTSTQQAPSTAPSPSFSFKPTTGSGAIQPPTAPTPPAPSSAAAGAAPAAPPSEDKPASNPFGFLSPSTTKPTDTSTAPSIKVTPPTPAFPPPQPSAAPTPPNTVAEAQVATKPSPAPLASAVTSQPAAAIPAFVANTSTPVPSLTSVPAPAAQPSLFAPAAAAPTRVPPAPTKEERWDAFARWFVTGDTGLMDQFEMFIVEEAVRKAQEQYLYEEAERVRREEDERSWAEARKFRTYSLGVKFFYRWREIARQNRASALRRSARDQLKAYHDEKRLEAAKKKKEAEREQRRLALEAGVDNLEDLKVLIRKRSVTTRETEDAILATGVLSGVRNERGAAAQIVGRRSSLPTPPPVQKSSMPKFMHRIKASINESFSRPVDKTWPESSASSVTSSGAGGAKTKALREEFSGSVLKKTIARSRSRYSLPPSDSESQSSVSRVSARWRLKAMGLVTMPNGSVLPEYLADQIKYEGKRFPELGSLGMPPPDLPAAHPADEDEIEQIRPATMDGTGSRATFPSFVPSHRPHASVSAISTDPSGALLRAAPTLVAKRKRSSPDAGPDGNAEEDADQPDKSKRILLDTEKTIREMRRLREEMEEGTDWFKEQNDRLQSQMSSRAGTPWG